jgi:hypothetical protein
VQLLDVWEFGRFIDLSVQHADVIASTKHKTTYIREIDPRAHVLVVIDLLGYLAGGAGVMVGIQKMPHCADCRQFMREIGKEIGSCLFARGASVRAMLQ